MPVVVLLVFRRFLCVLSRYVFFAFVFAFTLSFISSFFSPFFPAFNLLILSFFHSSSSTSSSFFFLLRTWHPILSLLHSTIVHLLFVLLLYFSYIRTRHPFFSFSHSLTRSLLLLLRHTSTSDMPPILFSSPALSINIIILESSILVWHLFSLSLPFYSHPLSLYTIILLARVMFLASLSSTSQPSM